jgi:hypothetical protein
MNLLTGGRKARRRGWTHRLWLIAAGLTGFVVGAALIVRL